MDKAMAVWMKEGVDIGEDRAIKVIKLYDKGKAPDAIANETDIPLDDVEFIIREYETD